MERVRRMYVGTEAGVMILAEDPGGWEQERIALEGRFVDALVASIQGGHVGAKDT